MNLHSLVTFCILLYFSLVRLLLYHFSKFSVLLQTFVVGPQRPPGTIPLYNGNDDANIITNCNYSRIIPDPWNKCKRVRNELGYLT